MPIASFKQEPASTCIDGSSVVLSFALVPEEDLVWAGAAYIDLDFS